MVTMAGKQSDFTKALASLVELEYDAISAYESAISGLKNHEYVDKLTEFNQDHRHHLEEVSNILKAHDKEAV